MAKKKEPVGSGDLGNTIMSFKALLAHLRAMDFWAAFDDLQELMGELGLGLGRPAVKKFASSPESAVASCCDDLEAELEELEKEGKKAKAEAGGLGGMLFPLLLKALQAILAGLMAQKKEEEA